MILLSENPIKLIIFFCNPLLHQLIKIRTLHILLDFSSNMQCL